MTRRPVSGSDVASLLLRFTVGPMLAVHGANKVWGGGGLAGTAGWFESLGLRPGRVHARMAAMTELGAGAGLTLGAASPLPAAAVVGLMATAAATDHRGKGFFIFKGGWEYVGVVAAAATASAALGSGPLSVDRVLGSRRTGLGPAAVAVGLGVASAAALLAGFYRPTPPTADAAVAPSDSTADTSGQDVAGE